MANNFEYQLKLDDGTVKNFNVQIDSETRIITDNDEEEAPEWTRLEFKKCSHCQYKTGEKKYCPVAKNLAKASEAFKGGRSYVQLSAFVKADERLYGKRTDLQTALFSLFGLIMASSNCEHLRIFRSMARFHLPFSTVEETSVRILGTWLILQYLKNLQDPQNKITLEGLAIKYGQINIVNRGMMDRIRSIADGDASKNAIIILDSFCTLLPIEIESGLEEVKKILADVEM